MRDPRLYQIAVLSGLLAYGLAVLGFDVRPAQVALTIGAALLTQAAASRAAGLPRVDLRSALISALSLCLLLRTGEPLLGGLAAVIAVGSKFAIRASGKHVFNPTNVALVALLLTTDRVWVSSGQWGSAAFFGFLMAALGTLVVSRARRADVTFAFLLAWAAILIGRSILLGEPLTIPLHRLQSGALLLFAFFMISDPKTTPDARAGRLLFAALVAAGAWFVQFRLFVPNALLWSLAAVSPLTPLIDRLLRAERYAWPRAFDLSPWRWTMKRALVLVAAALAASILAAPPASAFCGFFVSKADAKLFNKASRVVMVRDGSRTVLTMAADYKGDPKEFALVIPVPTPIVRGQIHVGTTALVDHVDAFTAPRLVEYFDEDPCAAARFDKDARLKSLGYVARAAEQAASRAKALGVTIEARYTVGEYDILILSATQSGGLATWLVENGYKMPKGADDVLGSYIRQGMRFFVARVNLEEKARGGWQDLRPIQIAYESPKFMLPLRLGMLNADGAQEMFVYAITRTGRVEATNYRTVKIASGDEIPAFVKDDFAHFYRDMFARQADRAGSAVFVEYAWDMGWCDPCASEPLGASELRDLGVFWLPDGAGVQDAYVTRLHVRYDRAGFPEDLVFQATPNKENFQGRYVLRHPWTGATTCDAAIGYRKDLLKRLQDQASTLAGLTGWDRTGILARMDLAALQSQVRTDAQPWWSGIWGQQPN
jgi:Na+-translocating ferredoxin:NAD+ oxidoreductase RnfD subunit